MRLKSTVAKWHQVRARCAVVNAANAYHQGGAKQCPACSYVCTANKMLNQPG